MARSTRSTPRASRNATPTRARRYRRRLSPPHGRLGPASLNGGLMPELEDQVPGSTTGLYFGQFQAIAEKKRFASVKSSRHENRVFIDVRDGFSFDTDADDIYRIRVNVDKRRYYVCGTYDQSSPDTNTSLASFGVNETFKGDIAVFFHTVHEPERFLDYLPRYKDTDEKEDALRRVLTAFARNVRNHIEANTTLRYVVRG
ncbi:hypothetical protein FB446DRAFT_790634 [Lentinula raphanica]|nr:hypothetical protein FB446DRAFT_790634 [Lentinula raphanica]KAJ3820833.1 hypothetical protein F5880DRAFT_1615211 [Lentinula raphanica]